MQTTRRHDESPSERTGFRRMLRALQSRNYRLYFTGQSISLIGTWMTRLATSWLVYRLTNSALLLGLVSFAGQIPSVLVTPLAGVLVDRWDRYHLLIVTQVLAMLQVLALAVLTFTGLISIWSLLALSFLQGVINAVDMPTRQTFVVELIEHKEDVANAIALNSSMVNAARLIGPALGGVLIAVVGEAWCFLLDSISYIAVITSLLVMKLSQHQRPAQATRLTQQLREGWTYIWGFTPIRNILLLLALVSLAGMPYSILMPVFASEVLHGGPNTLGLLMAASGVGALLGALYLTTRRSVLGLGKFLPWSAGMFGAGLIGFAYSGTLWLSMLLLVITGLGFMLQMAASNTLLQTIAEEDKRGRVMSFYTLAFMGPMPLGSLFAGSLAHTIGITTTVMLGGALCVIAACWFAQSLPALRQQVYPIYVKAGILKQKTTQVHLTASLTSSLDQGEVTAQVFVPTDEEHRQPQL